MLQKTTTPFVKIDHPPSRLAQIIVGASGVLFVLVALALLFVPRWFFENVGFFPPYNRHYEGDLGAFLFAIGAGLVYAARNPAKYRLLIAVAAVGSALHVLNHVFDGIASSYSLTHWLTDTAPLVIAALLLIVAWRQSKG
ncbi:MAG: hypothetical protein HY741_25700 [Chloroflexi bacterium]|nr:hypothetical protein [Chloroflexota bacterium]